jgi:hypothetical protein
MGMCFYAEACPACRMRTRRTVFGEEMSEEEMSEEEMDDEAEEICTAHCKAAIASVPFRNCCSRKLRGLCTAWSSQKLVGMVAFIRREHAKDKEEVYEVYAFTVPQFRGRSLGRQVLSWALGQIAARYESSESSVRELYFDWKESEKTRHELSRPHYTNKAVAKANTTLTSQQWIWEVPAMELDDDGEGIVSGRLILKRDGVVRDTVRGDNMTAALDRQSAADRQSAGQPRERAAKVPQGCILCDRMMGNSSRNVIFPAGLGTGCCHCKHLRDRQSEGNRCEWLVTKERWALLQAMWYGIIHNAVLVITGEEGWCSDQLVKQWAGEEDQAVFEPIFRLCRSASKRIVEPSLRGALGPERLEYVVEQHILNLKRHFKNLLEYVDKERDDMHQLTKVCAAAQTECWTTGPDHLKKLEMAQLVDKLHLTGERLRRKHSDDVWKGWDTFFKFAAHPDVGSGYFDYRRLDKEMKKGQGRGQCCRKWTPYGADTRDKNSEETLGEELKQSKETLGEERKQSSNEWHATTGHKTFLRYACLHVLRSIQTSQDAVTEFRNSNPGHWDDYAADKLIDKLLDSIDVENWEWTDEMDEDGFSCFFGHQPAAGETLTCIHRHGRYRGGRRYNSPCSVCACHSAPWLRLACQDFNKRQERDLSLLNSWSEDGQKKVRTLHPPPCTPTHERPASPASAVG